MSLIKIIKNLANFKKNNSPSEHQNTPKDEIESGNAFCPTCGVLLQEMPLKKIKCPECQNYIFIITNSKTKKKVLVTEQQKIWNDAQIKTEREIKSREKLEQNPDYVSVRDRLRQQYKKEPSIYDVSWNLANQYLIEYARKNNWAGYRNVKLEMAQLLQKEKRLDLSLRTYLELCYIDLNGPMNPGINLDPELQKEFPPFDIRIARLAPGVIAEIVKLIKGLHLDIDEVKGLFFEIANVNYRALQLPVSPSDAWVQVEFAIKSKNSH